MNHVEQNIDRLLSLLVSTPTLADQLVEHFDETIHAVNVEVSYDETQMFLKSSAAHPGNGHFIPALETASPSCTYPDDNPNPFTVFITSLTRN